MSNLPVLFGITHDPATKEVIARVPRAVKVAIGRPKGPALHVCLVWNKEQTVMGWQLEVGVGKQIQRSHYTLDQREHLERDMAALRPKTPDRKFPEKLPYFSFYKDRGDGQLVHDLDAILLHGVKPTAIDIMFTDSGPFFAEYQWWGTKGKICAGDSITAVRLNANPLNPAQKKLAETSAASGFKHFLVDDGCFLGGCSKAGKDCKPHGYLSFQLLQDLRIGSKAEIATTSVASISQFYASLKELATFLGGGDETRANLRGLPLTLTLRPFRTNHNDIPGVAYKMAVEFRAGNRETMKAKLIEAAETFGLISRTDVKQIAASTLKQIAAPAEDPETVVDATTLPTVEGAEDQEDVDEGITAAQNAVFFDGAEGGEGEEPDEEDDEQKKETVAEAGSSLMAETEARLRAAQAERLAAQQAQTAQDAKPEPQETAAKPVDDLGAHRYEKPKETPAAAPAAAPKKPLFGGKK